MLNELNKITHKKSKRVGRGIGSGKGGHTTVRGNNGQKARSGSNIPIGFEGGQVPIYKKFPKIGGFRNPTKKDVIAVTLGKFNKFRENSTVSPKDLVEKNIIGRLPKHGVKIIKKGKLEKALKFKGFKFSESVKKEIEKSKGEIQN